MNHTISIGSLFCTLPDYPDFVSGIRRAPKRPLELSDADIKLALNNALRYIPKAWHAVLAPEFLDELLTRGRIYGYRFRPQGNIFARPIETYQANTLEGKAIQVMMDNNLNFDVALYPYELVTYGETGQVCQNWMQYHLIKAYLQTMKKNETLHVFSGHPLGLFVSNEQAPRLLITNGLMVGLYDTMDQFHRLQALGTSNYGQMTAGGLMYIGPQGIVHGTYSTLLNAGRLKLGTKSSLAGKLFVSSGLGGMSGAQGKAIEIAGGVGIIAEVDASRIQTRFQQKWISKYSSSLEEVFRWANQALADKKPLAIAYLGNVVTLLEYAVKHRIHIDLLSDQTSCHAVYEGGYCPVSLSYQERTALLEKDKSLFVKRVNQSLVRHYQAIAALVEQHTYFFDYGNSFLKALYDAGIQAICRNQINDQDGFIYPSYVEDIMGPLLFDYGFGPFRWVCLSGKEEDLDLTDQTAMNCINPNKSFQDRDNYEWIKNAKKNQLVVGSKARILYQDARGRVKIALAFNQLVREGKTGPIMLGRDHHDTGGTDSPFRETANILDGSNRTADMATQVALGNASRGMSMVALHNGGGVGIGKSINGGYGLVLDGSKKKDAIIKSAVYYDVMAGVARRSWARNPHAMKVAEKEAKSNRCRITLPETADESLLTELLGKRGLK
ncbi:MAG: urocanate hydratase [Bacilli bacterium]|jgi:urocanate hydratase|nr:urocanate hydratase [Bacilli bacterium]